MAQYIKVNTAKPTNQSSIPKPHKMEGTRSFELSSNLHTYIMAHTCLHKNLYVCTK